MNELVAKIIKDKGFNMAALSKAVGKNSTYVQQFVKYGQPATLPEVVRHKLAHALGVHESVLRSGALVSSFDPDIPDDPRDFFDADKLAAAGRAEKRRLRPGEVVERDLAAGMGIGGQAEEIIVDGVSVDDVKTTWTFPVPFLHNELQALEPDLDIVMVRGDSMTPTLLPGDRVMVHRLDRTPSPPGLFMIHDGIAPSVKRLQIVIGSDPKQIRVLCDNPGQEGETILVSDLVVIGRVICKISRT